MSVGIDEPIEGELIEVKHSTIAELNRSEIDIQISTAHAYPRSIKEFKRKAMELATLDEDTAGSMFYVLPRAGKKIEGPSVRLAEVVGSAFGNLRYSARVVSVDREFITAQGMCHDLEGNNAACIEIKRRITDKNGRRYNADMIQTTGNAACAIALREAIFKVVPRALFKDVYEQARLTSVGKNKPMVQRRHDALDWFKKAGATEADVLAFLDRPGVDDITIDDLIQLTGVRTSIKDGDISIEDALKPREEVGEGSKVAASNLNEKLATAKAKKAANGNGGVPSDPVAEPTADTLFPKSQSATEA